MNFVNTCSYSALIMNKNEFIKQIRVTAMELKPLTESTARGAMTWNGSEYVKSVGEPKTPDPYALAWWFTLTAIAELIEAQETPLTVKQIAYLDNLLFGGMGSFNDLNFDPNSMGEIAGSINNRLNIQRSALYASFRTS